MTRQLLDEQIAYYRARAHEYDEWFFRRGRYDRGEEFRRAWTKEIETVEAALAELRPFGRVLELACGTGLWTRRLVEAAESVTAVDASAEVIELNRERVRSSAVRYVEADLFEWRPGEPYDLVFFGFWLSHVPPPRFAEFWALVRACLAPGGTAFFVDNKRNYTSRDHQQLAAEDEDYVVLRELNDRRRFRVVKVFYEPDRLETTLGELGWQASVRASGEFFLYGRVR
jgi:demethylmenaquinone methyltransferase/2-methoxy-6-polyprenyl-1,4-benzoquinol methylase